MLNKSECEEKNFVFVPHVFERMFTDLGRPLCTVGRDCMKLTLDVSRRPLVYSHRSLTCWRAHGKENYALISYVFLRMVP